MMANNKNTFGNGLECGIIICARWLDEHHHDDDLSIMLLKEYGLIDPKSWEKLPLDESDLEWLRKITSHEAK